MQKTDLCHGSILQGLLLFSLPMIAGNLLQQVYNLADTLIVGRYIGPDGLASVGASYALMTFLTSILIGLCMGSGAFLSSDYGAEKIEQLKEDTALSFLFIGGCTLIMMIILYPFTDGILHLLQIPSDLFDMMKSYITIIFAGIPAVFLYNFLAYSLRSLGNSMAPLFFLSISSFLNIVLDVLFITRLHAGVAGAASATVIAQHVCALGLLIYTAAVEPICREVMLQRRIDWNRMQIIMKNDASTCLQQSIMNFGILMIQGLVNSFGAVIMASFAAAVKIDTLAYMPAQEFGNASSLFISANHGAGRKDRIHKGLHLSFLVSGIYCFCISALIFLYAGNLMGIFVDASHHEIIQEGIRYLRIEGAAYVFIGFLFLWYGYFRGMGKPQISLFLTVISLGTRVVLSYTLAPYTPLGVTAVWLSIPIGWFLADLAGGMIYRKEQQI